MKVTRQSLAVSSAHDTAPVLLSAIAFAVLAYYPLTTLVRDWWEAPEAIHGFVLTPVALWLAWKAGRDDAARPQPALGLAILFVAVLLRYAAGVTTEFFILRGSILGVLIGLTIFHAGVRQVLHWWLPFVLLFLSIPLPELVTQSLALPLQSSASRLGVALLDLRHVPARLSGNVIQLSGQELFVAEVCSGLRFITGLLGATVLFGALFLRTLVARGLVVLVAIPVAVVVNAVRVFLIAFLAVFVSPKFGSSFMRLTDGWPMLLISLVALGAFAATAVIVERRFRGSASVA
jgi:exosortase